MNTAQEARRLAAWRRFVHHDEHMTDYLASPDSKGDLDYRELEDWHRRHCWAIETAQPPCCHDLYDD